MPAPPDDRPPIDPLWPRASEWLEAGTAGATIDLAFVGVPAWRTSLSPTQAHRTPAAVRAALSRFSAYSAFHDRDVAELVTVRDLGDIPDPDEDEDRTTSAVREGAESGRLLVACGGDNSITYAVMRGAVTNLDTAGLVTLDAHHDVRNGTSNGSPVRRLVDAGLDPHRIVQIGIRDYVNSRAYSERARNLGIHVIRREELYDQGMRPVMARAFDIAGSAGGDVYVDLDVDVCDQSVAPACPASAPGGLSAAELLAAAFAAGDDPRVVAIDITEVDAGADAGDGRTVRLAALCLLSAATGLAGR